MPKGGKGLLVRALVIRNVSNLHVLYLHRQLGACTFWRIASDVAMLSWCGLSFSGLRATWVDGIAVWPSPAE